MTAITCWPRPSILPPTSNPKEESTLGLPITANARCAKLFWRFRGYVTSDGGALQMLVDMHHVAADFAGATRDVFNCVVTILSTPSLRKLITILRQPAFSAFHQQKSRLKCVSRGIKNMRTRKFA